MEVNSLVSERSPYVLGLCTPISLGSKVDKPHTGLLQVLETTQQARGWGEGQNIKGIEPREVSWGGAGPGEDAGSSFFL